MPAQLANNNDNTTIKPTRLRIFIFSSSLTTHDGHMGKPNWKNWVAGASIDVKRHHGSGFWGFSFEKLLYMLKQIFGWVSCWLKTIITDAVAMDILKKMRRFKFSATRTHYPPCVGKFRF
jgi:hypothetical protein